MDACTYVAGPFATMMLADLGADVFKVEPPGGDPNRRFGVRSRGTGLLFVNTNRNKRSIELDLKSGEDRDLLDRLISEADVLAENWRPGLLPGEGQRVEVSMLGAAAYFNFPDVLAERTVVGDDGPLAPERNPGLKTLIKAADGYLVLAPGSGAHVRRACEAAGHPEWVEELSALRSFAELAPALMGRLGSVTASNTVAHWVATFEAADVPVGPVLDVDGHLADPQVAHNGTYTLIDHPELGTLRGPRFPVSAAALDGRDAVAWSSAPAPLAGQHRAAVEANSRWQATPDGAHGGGAGQER